MKPTIPAAVVLMAIQIASAADVTLIEADNSYILENGILTGRVDKRSGKLESLKYNGLEMLDRQGGYWSHSAASPNVVASITIDPKSNSGERAEVSIKGVSK